MFHSKDQESNFEQLLEVTIAKLTKKTKVLRSAYYFFSITTLFLSALLTMILGYNLKDNTNLILSKNIALVIGAIITFLTGLSTFWKLESYWVRRKILLRRLEDLRDEFIHQKLSSNAEDLEHLFSKYQSIQNYSTIYWEDVYNEAKSPNKSDKTQTPKTGS